MSVEESRGFELEILTHEHVDDFLPRMIAANHREFEEIHRQDPHAAVHGVVGQPYHYAVVWENKVVCVTGLIQMSSYGLFWVLFSDELMSQKVRFIRTSRDLIKHYFKFCNELRCRFPARYTQMAAWLLHLKFMPFSMDEHNGHDLVTFVRCSKPVDPRYLKSIRPA